MTRAKPWYQSKTLWVNATAAALLAVESQLHLLQPLVPVSVYLLVAMALPFINVLLRAITYQPISLTKPVDGLS